MSFPLGDWEDAAPTENKGSGGRLREGWELVFWSLVNHEKEKTEKDIRLIT